MRPASVSSQSAPLTHSNPEAIGIDAGSTTCKVVVVDATGTVLVGRVEPSDPHVEDQTMSMVRQVRAAVDAREDLPIAATGYGRKRVAATKVLTEITCHAKGAFHQARKGGVLIDIGGQDTKIIRIADQGRIVNFVMNDKCAAGTGRFLEVVLSRLQIGFDDIAAIVVDAPRAVDISNTCAVFAESEVVSLLAQGESIAGIVQGLHRALSARVVTLAGPIESDMELFLSGGVALNSAMVAALEATLGRPVSVIPDPQLVGAIGAALSVLP